ncbi:glycosyltransferase [Sphingorhabdus sp. Alg231-15]|uniref:glycosyltransferase n=1 Tax=Sphingorhabdus sp. Alg231-15 TaxID=1922222 RepID=UPI000D56189E
MQILYFHQHFSTPSGSAGTRSYEMARQLIEAGHQVTMVCGSNVSGKTGLEMPFINGKRRGIANGIDIIEFDLTYGNRDGFIKRSLTFIAFAWQSSLIAFREPTDIVFATTTPLTAGIPGIIAKWFRKKPFVFEVRDLWPELPKAMGVITNPFVLYSMRVLEWVSYKSADRLVGLSPGIVDGIAQDVHEKSRIALIPNGCDLKMFSDKSKFWRPKQTSASDFLAIFAGTHGKANGLGAVVDAAAVLKDRGVTNIKLVLVGDGAEKPFLAERVQSEALEQIVILLDQVPKTQLPGLMASADVGLQILANIPAFYYGTSPNKFFDYLAAGLPVITNYPGWVADLVKEYDCGVSVPPQDPNAFADALIQMRNDRDLRQKSLNARTLGETKFARDKLGEKFVRFIVEDF